MPHVRCKKCNKEWHKNMDFSDCPKGGFHEGAA